MTKQIFHIILIFCLAFVLKSCANMAQGPVGGEKDETPPKYKKSTPIPNSVNYRKNKIEIEFDEYIVLDNPSKNLIVSPPQDIFPVAKGIGKKVSVEIKDSLLPNTTYTLDFGNAIVDNNERNPLADYVFSFSTGPDIDTMSISGTIINAQNLARVSDVYVGVYSNLDDTAFTTGKMERIAKTNASGNFVIRNLAAKPYRVYALEDVNNNYYFDQKLEGIAVLNEIVTPELRLNVKTDTIFKDSVTIDSIITRNVIQYLPDSLQLRFYREEDDRQYFIKAERNDAAKFTLYFKNVTKQMPQITPINFVGDDWLIPEPSVTKDTLLYWIKDSLIFKQDTLQLAIDYEKTDSAGILIAAKDTIELVSKAKTEKPKRKKEKEETVFTETLRLPNSVEYYDNPEIEWKNPLLSFGEENLSLLAKKDTLWEPVEFTIRRDSSKNLRTYVILAKLTPEGDYKLKIDSASVTDIYGNHNKEIETKVKIRSKEEYANLSILLKNAPEGVFLELLNKSDVAIMKTSVENGKGHFQYIKPGEYFVRMVADRNGNGKWDTGNYNEKIEPEEVFYFNKKLKLRANWDMEEDWNIAETPLLLQKPEEIKSPPTIQQKK